TNKTIGICGYSNKRCPVTTGDSFCKSSSPLEFNGGLTGVDDGLFSYYILDLYWPPSNCPLKYNESTEFLTYFCSPYTDINEPGRERLALHGLWPTFSTSGNYQGWSQFCSSANHDWSKCHINGDLCPWQNATKNTFNQVDYEYCLSIENRQECLINPTDILLPEQERLKLLAPGYLGPRNLFINHEWTKHGSCCSLIFQHNISYYLTFMLDLVDMATRPGSLTYEYIQRNAGEKVGLDYLVEALNQTAIINCNSKCELDEIQLCMHRDHHTGLPTRFVACPPGARNNSDSCKKAHCEYVLIPLSKEHRQIHTDDYDFPSIWTILLSIIVLLILIKYLVLLCGACYHYL
ncbi:unnamed protein product, partial [Rotaria magnacalcarata]